LKSLISARTFVPLPPEIVLMVTPTKYDNSYRQYTSFNFRNYGVPAGHIFHLVGSDRKAPLIPSVS